MTFGTTDVIKWIRLIIVIVDGMKVHLVVADICDILPSESLIIIYLIGKLIKSNTWQNGGI